MLLFKINNQPTKCQVILRQRARLKMAAGLTCGTWSFQFSTLTGWLMKGGLFPRGLTTTLNCTLVQKLGHGTFRFDAWTERRVVPDKGMRTHLTISLFSLQGFFCFSFFFSCFVFYLRIFCEIFLRFLFLNTPEYRGLLPFYNAFNIF